MRIVVSGTHATGKSTLIADFAASHRGWTVLPDPYELIDAASDEPDAGTFFAQLRLSAERLHEVDADELVIAERGPVDFLAYLDALDALRRPTRAPGLRGRAADIASDAMRLVDLLVVLPLTSRDDIHVSDEEDPQLRDAMNDALLELIDDPDVVADAVVVEIAGDRASRLRQLEGALETFDK